MWSGGREILLCGEATVCSGTVAVVLIAAKGKMRSGGEILLCGEATVCSGTVAVLLIAANRTGVEWWW